MDDLFHFSPFPTDTIRIQLKPNQFIQILCKFRDTLLARRRVLASFSATLAFPLDCATYGNFIALFGRIRPHQR